MLAKGLWFNFGREVQENEIVYSVRFGYCRWEQWLGYANREKNSLEIDYASYNGNKWYLPYGKAEKDAVERLKELMVEKINERFDNYPRVGMYIEKKLAEL